MGDQPNSAIQSPGTVGPIPKPDKWRKVPVPGFGDVPLPPLALYCLAILAVVAGGIKVYTMWEQVEAALTNDEVALFKKHYLDTDKVETMVWHNESGRLVVDYYNGDGAILVTRLSSDTRIPPVYHWIVDLSNIPLQPPPGPTSGGHLSSALDGNFTPPYPLLSNMSVEAAGPVSREYGQALRIGFDRPDFPTVPLQKQQGQGCAGRCLNPHPGPFQTWNGQVNGCFVQVWRRWADGCTHYQWWNSCYNYWDPQIWWTCCVH